MLVGFVRPEDGTIQRRLSNDFAGTYNTAGEKLLNGPISNEYKYLDDVNGLRLRAYQFYNDNGQGDEVEMWGPRIDVVDGNEPTIEELIFPTIDSDILYSVKKRPSSKVVYKLNNFSTTVLGVTESINVNSITTNDINYNNQLNYNENLKFIDNTQIGSYYNVAISDMANPQESEYISQSDDVSSQETANVSGGESTYNGNGQGESY